MFKQKLSKEQALQKLKHYCGYQERCHFEVKQKLFELQVARHYHDEITAALIEEDYLNEERFAIAFAGGKWRMKQWGRIKIKQELKLRQISDYCIKKSLQQIDEAAYEKVILKFFTEKYALLKNEQYLVRKKKCIDFLLQKGFELDLVMRIINEKPE